MKLQNPDVVTLPAQVLSDIKRTAMVVLELSQQIDDIVLPVMENDERIELLDVLVISLREHAKILLEKIRLTVHSAD